MHHHPRWRTKTDPEIAEMRALAAAYRGPVTHCPPGVARAHEVKTDYAPPPRSNAREANAHRDARSHRA